MLLRRDDRGVLAIGQPAHAWISGQLARAWGNERFGAVAPWEEVCLAAEQHDVGMALWDLEPTWNPETWLPHGFTEMPLETHISLWHAGPRRLVRQSRHAALLCSIHGTRLYELRDLELMPAPEAETVREFIAEQREFQRELTATLQADAATRDDVAPARLARNSQLIWSWDYLSLALCLSWAPCAAKYVPTAEDPIAVTLSPGPDGEIRFDPWPFGADRVSVHCEGQRLAPGYPGVTELRRGLETAPWETLRLELRPASTGASFDRGSGPPTRERSA